MIGQGQKTYMRTKKGACVDRDTIWVIEILHIKNCVCCRTWRSTGPTSRSSRQCSPRTKQLSYLSQDEEDVKTSINSFKERGYSLDYILHCPLYKYFIFNQQNKHKICQNRSYENKRFNHLRCHLPNVLRHVCQELDLRYNNYLSK